MLYLQANFESSRKINNIYFCVYALVCLIDFLIVYKKINKRWIKNLPVYCNILFKLISDNRPPSVNFKTSRTKHIHATKYIF